MGPDAIAITIMIIFAIVMFILHRVAYVHERGQSPHWAAEVYFYNGGGPTSPRPQDLVRMPWSRHPRKLRFT